MNYFEIFKPIFLMKKTVGEKTEANTLILFPRKTLKPADQPCTAQGPGGRSAAPDDC